MDKKVFFRTKIVQKNKEKWFLFTICRVREIPKACKVSNNKH